MNITTTIITVIMSIIIMSIINMSIIVRMMERIIIDRNIRRDGSLPHLHLLEIASDEQ